MTNLPRTASRNMTSKLLLSSFIALSTLTIASTAANAQASAVKIADRISGQINNSSRAELTGSAIPRAMHSTDLGAVPSDTPLQGISIAFSRSAAQQADLAQLIVAQQTPGSSLYHQWLTPAQFGARFGVSDNDLAATESWLQSQGFTIESVSPSRDRITFAGAEAAVESAFGTPLHYFKATSGSLNTSDLTTHVAPAHALTLPSALSSVVLAVSNLSDYRPHSYAIQKPTAAFTSGQSGSHYMTPKDIATIYDLNPAYNAGFTGSGQTIAVVGQSGVLASDISNFQTAAGVNLNPINQIIIPNSGTTAIYTGDESESDLDLEYTSSIANKATIDFVYAGNSPYYGVFDAFVYAIQNDIAQIVTISYGECEPDLGISYYNQYESTFQQAAAQGQTVINSSGDSGSTGCYGDGNTTAYQEQVAVSYPASSAYVTGVGGTEFLTSAIAACNNQYFTAVTDPTCNPGSANGTDAISSALSYIPEQAWNDDAATGNLSSGGGGISIFTPRPSWQAGVTGIPSGSYRLVPDISLDSSPNNAGYLYCTSDTGSGGTNVAGSCANPTTTNFRGSNGQSLTVAGGTSFAAPIFAGMMAIINQAKGYNTGSGLVNPTLYTLASNSTTYASAFHDITSGGNQCLAGSSICGTGAAVSDYATNAGYDEATGLGSLDVYNLLTAWPKSASNLLGSATTVTAATLTPAAGASDTITVTLTGTGVTPTGTIAVTDNGATVTGSPFTLVNGNYSYNYSTTVTGVHKLVFTYSGDANYGSSKGTVGLNVGSTSFTIAAPAISITAGSSGSGTITVATTNGYTGTVLLTVSYPAALTNSCYTATPTSAVLTTAAPSATINYTIYTAASSCTGSTVNPLHVASSTKAPTPAPRSPWRNAPIPATFAGLLILGCFKRRSKLLRGGIALGIVLVLSLSGLGITGCSSGASGNTTATNPTTTTTTGNATAGTYTLTITGTDSVDSAVSNTGTLTLTVH
jgi:subtilase family serine protease